MDIYPVYILNIILIIVIVRIKTLMNDENNHHLGYMIFHFLFQLISTINISIHSLFEVKAPIVIICVGRVFAFIFFYLYLKSILEKRKSKITLVYFIPGLLLLFFDILNSSGYIFFHFTSNQILSENILGFFTTDFIGKEDLFLMCCVNTMFFTILIFNKFYQIKKTEILDQKKKGIISDFFKYYYIPISIISISTLIIIGLFLQNIKLFYFITFIKLFAILTLLILVIKPSLIKRLASIKKEDHSDDGLNEIFEKITKYFKTTNNFLNANYMPANIAVDLKERNEVIRNSIKKFSNMTVPLFINSHRVDFACKLIREGYLDNYSMDAISEKSGFSSQKNFNRVFKIIKSLTPSEYKNHIK